MINNFYIKPHTLFCVCLLVLVKYCSIAAAFLNNTDEAATIYHATSGVSSFGYVFDSATGYPIDNVRVTLYKEQADGKLTKASVYGDDGDAIYPSIISSGSTATDSAGNSYRFPNGGYRYPQLAPGSYRLVITPPSNYAAPSKQSIEQLQNLPNGPFVIVANASFEKRFTLQQGEGVQIDIPLDPVAASPSMTLRKFYL